VGRGNGRARAAQTIDRLIGCRHDGGAFPMHTAPESPAFGVPDIPPVDTIDVFPTASAWAAPGVRRRPFASGELWGPSSPVSQRPRDPRASIAGPEGACIPKQNRLDILGNANSSALTIDPGPACPARTSSRPKQGVDHGHGGRPPATRTEIGNRHVAVPPGVLAPGRRKGRLR
jgi:hypothetical protein